MEYIEVYILSNQKDVHFSNSEFYQIYKSFSKKSYKKYTTFNKQVLKTYHHNIILEETFDDIHSQKLSVKDTVYTLVQKPYEDTIYGALKDNHTLVKYYTKITKPLHKIDRKVRGVASTRIPQCVRQNTAGVSHDGGGMNTATISLEFQSKSENKLMPKRPASRRQQRTGSVVKCGLKVRKDAAQRKV